MPTIAQQARQAQIEVEDEVEDEVEVGTQAAPAHNTRLGVRYSVDLDDLIAQIANGALLRDLEPETGVTRQRLSQILRDHPGYAQAKRCQLEARLDRAEAGMDAAPDGLSLARAREQFRAAAWRAERECPELWGQHTQVTVSQGDLGERLRRARERVIDAAPQQTQDIGPLKSTNA